MHALAWTSFVASLDSELRSEATDEVRATLTEKLASAAAHLRPDDTDEFSAYIGERMPTGQALAESLKQLHAADLAFAFALAHGREGALATFEHDLVPGLVAAARNAVRGVDPAETMQEVRIFLLVGDGSTPPRIRDFRGSGPLKGWLRITVLRRSLTRANRPTKETPVEDAFFDSFVGAMDASISNHLFSAPHVDAVKAALRHAIGQLSNREKGLLQYAFIDGASLEQIASTYRAHRTTIARWLELARDRVKREVEAHLRERLGLSSSEAQSLVRHTMTAVDSTLGQLLDRG